MILYTFYMSHNTNSGSPENQTILSSITNVALIIDGNGNNTGEFKILKAVCLNLRYLKLTLKVSFTLI